MWVFVVRTLTWCPQILEMWSIHTGEQINNGKNPTGKDCVTLHRTTAYHCCHSLHAFAGSCEKFSFLRYNSWSALPWKYEPGQNRIRTFLKTPVVFSGFSLLSLERCSLAVFAGVQDVVHLVFHVFIKWEAALLVHHFVVRQRLIESAFLLIFCQCQRSVFGLFSKERHTTNSPVWPVLTVLITSFEKRRQKWTLKTFYEMM